MTNRITILKKLANKDHGSLEGEAKLINKKCGSEMLGKYITELENGKNPSACIGNYALERILPVALKKSGWTDGNIKQLYNMLRLPEGKK